MRRALLAGLIAAGIALFGLAPARAQDADACAGFKWPLTRERAAMTAAGLPVVGSGATLPAIGQAVTLTLAPEAGVAYTLKPAKAPKANPAYGAELSLAGTEAGGPIQVTLSDEAWVDVVQNGKALRSTAFSGKTGCPGLRKSVRFTIEPGPLAIAISDAPSQSLTMAVMPAE